jgi:hypothetical protein
MNFKHGMGRKLEARKCLQSIFLPLFFCQPFAVGLTVMGLLGSGLDGYGQDTGLAPEVSDLNAEDVSYELEHQLLITIQPHDLNELSAEGHDVPWGTGKAEFGKLLEELHRLGVTPTLLGLEYFHDYLDNMPEMAESVEFFNRATREMAGQ